MSDDPGLSNLVQKSLRCPEIARTGVPVVAATAQSGA